MQGELKTAAHAEAFMFGGNARLTLRSDRTGTHFTYRITRCDDKPELFFVGLLTGSDNESNYVYLGTIRIDSHPAAVERVTYKHGRKSKIDAKAPGAFAFEWFCHWLFKGEIKQGVRVFHEGRCARCARPLTHPESIISGFGPECIKRVGFVCEAA